MMPSVVHPTRYSTVLHTARGGSEAKHYGCYAQALLQLQVTESSLEVWEEASIT